MTFAEITRRRIKVTSSLYEISADQLGNNSRSSVSYSTFLNLPQIFSSCFNPSCKTVATFFLSFSKLFANIRKTKSAISALIVNISPTYDTLCAYTLPFFCCIRNAAKLQRKMCSCVLEVRPARRTDASAPLSAGVASLPPPVGRGEVRICCI